MQNQRSNTVAILHRRDTGTNQAEALVVRTFVIYLKGNLNAWPQGYYFGATERKN
jgi:hypothetical protein